MKALPNGLKVFNATPHPITFWREGWEEPVVVEVDMVISAKVEETVVRSEALSGMQLDDPFTDRVEFVRSVFVPDEAGHRIIEIAHQEGADVIVGSIIAAQAYPGDVVAMVPAPGFERVPPAEKRMRPDKFTTFEENCHA